MTSAGPSFFWRHPAPKHVIKKQALSNSLNYVKVMIIQTEAFFLNGLISDTQMLNRPRAIVPNFGRA